MYVVQKPKAKHVRVGHLSLANFESLNRSTEFSERGYVDAKTACVPQCEEAEVLIAKDIIGETTNQICIAGMTALCCTTDLPAPADCIFTGKYINSSCHRHLNNALVACSATPDTSCPSDFSNFQTSLSTARGVCADGTAFGFCCENPLPYGNCQWKGTPPFCK